ncbi:MULTISPECIES: alpha/beta hydrolase [unclassified Sphingomonas]|uniref:alpha/beta hydrolase n=1 Tax=unclassified Sphingomonas TaxID=196159 RepID=UPI0009E83D50|nr:MULTISPECIES: alpha/beta hydrolase [unclassified Sphingomonas]
MTVVRPVWRSITLASLAVTAVPLATIASAQMPATNGTVIPLYPKGSVPSLGVPEQRDQLPNGETVIYDVSEPTLELYRPAPGRTNGTAVIVAPGGGFVALGYTFGGTEVARALAARGITAFVLKYRTIRSGDGPMRMPDVHMREMDVVMSRAKTGMPVEMPRFAGEPHAVEDGARAMAIVRQRASEWGIDPRRVGILGFSAGAYLAADLAIGEVASRPDFVGFIYGGLRTPVPADAPPAFIAGAADDEYQPNDPVLLYQAWRRAGAAAELHLYERGGHGFDLRPQRTPSDRWFDAFTWWLTTRLSAPSHVPHRPATDAPIGPAK